MFYVKIEFSSTSVLQWFFTFFVSFINSATVHKLLEVVEYTGLLTSQQCCKGDVQCSCSVGVRRTYFICARLTAIEEGNLSVGTIGSWTGTGILKDIGDFESVSVV